MTEAVFPLVPIMREGLDPVAELARIRAERAVVRLEIPDGPWAWLVTRYDDVRAVLADHHRFSNAFANLAAVGGAEMFTELDPGGLGFRDPPDHTRLRRMLTPEFTTRRLRRLEPLVERIVAEHLDAMEAAGPPADLVAAFATPIPFLVICELLGVPHADRDEFARVSSGRFEFSGDGGSSLTAVNEALVFLADLVARQRRKPGEGLLGMLVGEHGDDVSERELAGLADGLLTGGHDTTASMLALGTLVLLSSPEIAAAVRDGEQVAAVVEELLRFLTVVQVAFPRFAREDLVIAGQPIAAGDMVLCSLASANRDAALGQDTDGVHPAREAASHVAFGHGMHRCIGAPLAQLELAIAYPALLRRFPDLRVAVPAEELEFRGFSIVYGVQALPVTW
jgi:cytochrome P450